ncbi:MAG: heavy metal-associated domain-containing protein, partial [Lysinibacillus sp.]
MSSEQKEVNLQITGMTCAACAIRIEKGLNKMDGVETANVNLALEKSSIKYDPSKLSEADFEKKIEALGYGVVKQKAEFDITGMTCAACSTRIEKGLNKMAGIAVANVNLALEKATIEYNPSEVTIADIIAKVEKLGYGAHQKQSVDHREQAIQKQQK